MVSYETWSNGYLVLEPKSGKVHHAYDMIYHEASIGPIILPSIPEMHKQAVRGGQDETASRPPVQTVQTGSERLTIKILAQPNLATEVSTAQTDML